MDVQDRLDDFRQKAKFARTASDLIDLIDKELLAASGWAVHADSKFFIGASKITKDGSEYEIRVSRLNNSIGGTLTPKRHPPKPTKLDAFRLLMNGDPGKQLEVRKHHTEDLAWPELVKLI